MFIHTTYTEYYHRVSDIGGEHNEYEEYNGTFTLNPDGSINTETWTNADGTPFSSSVYRYTTIDQKSPVFEIECINLCSEKNFVCRQYKRKNAQYEEIAVYAEKGKDLVHLSEITRHARHNAQVSKSLCSVRVTSKRLAGRGFSFFLSKRNTLTTRKKHNENGARIDKGDGMGIGSSRPFFGR